MTAPSPTPEPNPWRQRADELSKELDHHERAVIQLLDQIADAEAQANAWEQPALFGDVVNLTEWKE